MKYICRCLLLFAIMFLLPAGALADELMQDDFAKVSCGSAHTLALRHNGDLWAWGLNDRGQVGNGGESDSLSQNQIPCQAKPVLVLDKVVSMAAGGTHSLAVKDDGSLWGWGMNYLGRLGFEGAERIVTPVKIMDDVLAVAAGEHFSLILKTDGSLWACGNNDLGQLGNGAPEETVQQPDDEPRPIEPQKIMEQVSAIAAGSSHALAVKEDGSLWAWGLNDFGQVGNGGATDMYGTCQSLPARIFESGVISVAAGEKHSLAIMADGALWGWGDNSGQCLQESDEEILTTPQKLLDEIQFACAASGRTLVIKEGGSLWGWGNNSYQAMDFNYKVDYVSPIPKKIMENVVNVSSGANHTMAVKVDGTLWGWGDNSCGQLGQAPGPLGLPVRVRVEYPAWPPEEEEEEEEAPALQTEPEPEPKETPQEPEYGSPLPFIIGCAVIAAGGVGAFIIWRKKRKGMVSEWRK